MSADQQQSWQIWLLSLIMSATAPAIAYSAQDDCISDFGVGGDQHLSDGDAVASGEGILSGMPGANGCHV